MIQPVVDWFQNTAWPTFRKVIGFIGDKFESFKRGLDKVWSFIRKNVIQRVADWFEKTIEPKLSRVTERISDAFDTMKAGIQTAWDGGEETQLAHRSGSWSRTCTTTRCDPRSTASRTS